MAENTIIRVNSIPIIIGVTGHRDLHPEQIPQIKEIARNQLLYLAAQYNHSPLVMLNSLAEGADQLCAEIALDLGIPLIAPIPLTMEDYATDFSSHARADFLDQCSKAAELFVVSPIEETKTINRHFSYRQAGIYIAKNCHILLALWDGSTPEPDGCGTAEVVDFMLNANYAGKNLGYLQTNDGAAVLHIFSMRQDDDIHGMDITVNLLENIPGALDSTLSKTDHFNQAVQEIKTNNNSSLIKQELLQQTGTNNQRLHNLYQYADNLSIHFRDKYLASIKWLSIFGVSLVLAFLFYDELDSNIFLYLYGGILLLSGMIFANIRKNEWHEKYLETRVLAESLRVQFYLHVSGINHSVCDEYTWSQRKEVVWVEKAINALTICANMKSSLGSATIKSDWIDGQHHYHSSKAVSTEKIRSKNERIATTMLIISILTFAVILIMEIFTPQILNIPIFSERINQLLHVHTGQQFIFRGIFKILLGLFAAVTLFLSNYYGKLSLDHKVTDHQKMANLYQSAQMKWDTTQIDKEKLLVELAREEIIENGVWLSYNRDNSPTLDF